MQNFLRFEKNEDHRTTVSERGEIDSVVARVCWRQFISGASARFWRIEKTLYNWGETTSASWINYVCYVAIFFHMQLNQSAKNKVHCFLLSQLRKLHKQETWVPDLHCFSEKKFLSSELFRTAFTLTWYFEHLYRFQEFCFQMQFKRSFRAAWIGACYNQDWDNNKLITFVTWM